MLRVSAQQTDRDIDIQLINGADSDSPGLEHGEVLADFAEALASFDEGRLTTARQALLAAAGPAVLVDAAGVAANFQRMVRIADSMGIPVDAHDNEISNQVREELDLYKFKSAENSTRAV